MEFSHIVEMVVSAVFTSGVVWGTLRTELKGLRDAIRDSKREAQRANVRMDKHLEGHV